MATQQPNAANTLDVRLQGKEYRVACAPEEKEALLSAVAFLDTRLAEIAAKTRSTGERLAVMTALNLAHELISLKQSANPIDGTELKRRIGSIEARVDAAIAETRQDDLF
ncbi:MAG: cell division protein ZapA [Rhodocyclaceae bacterium]|nr:cell division protein ZapA [Rhodocyclaceae bacterium]